jgi:hypothetical protein
LNIQTHLRPPANPERLVEIRPEAAMYAAFERLYYEPWYALAELVDIALQSCWLRRAELMAATAVRSEGARPFRSMRIKSKSSTRPLDPPIRCNATWL